MLEQHTRSDTDNSHAAFLCILGGTTQQVHEAHKAQSRHTGMGNEVEGCHPEGMGSINQG